MKHAKQSKQKKVKIAIASIAVLALVGGGYWFIRHNLLHADTGSNWWGPVTNFDEPTGGLNNSSSSTSSTTTSTDVTTSTTSTSTPSSYPEDNTAPVQNSDGSTSTYDASKGTTTTSWGDATLVANSDGSGTATIGNGPAITTQTLGPGGVVLTQTNPDGSVMDFKSDSNGSYTVVTWPPDAGQTQGNTMTILPSGVATAQIYDSTGHYTQNIVDGVVTSQTNPDNSIQTYSTSGVLQNLTLPNGTVYTYAANGNLASVYDGVTKKTTPYDPTTGKPGNTTDPSGAVVPAPASAPANGQGAGTPGAAGPASPNATKVPPTAPQKATTPWGSAGSDPTSGSGAPPTGTTAKAPSIVPAVGTFFGADLPTYVSNLYDWALVIGTGLAIIMIMWAGTEFILSAGDPEGVRSAKDYLTGAIIGLILLILTATVAKSLGVKTVQSATTSSTTTTTP